jgi:hypothetical protein
VIHLLPRVLPRAGVTSPATRTSHLDATRSVSTVRTLNRAFRMVRSHPPMSASDAPAALALVLLPTSSIDLVGAAAVHLDVDC